MFYTVTTPGLIIMDNFKGQVTENISSLLEKHHLHVCLLPANTTDLLQPMDISVNKPAKSFLKNSSVNSIQNNYSSSLRIRVMCH